MLSQYQNYDFNTISTINILILDTEMITRQNPKLSGKQRMQTSKCLESFVLNLVHFLSVQINSAF